MRARGSGTSDGASHVLSRWILPPDFPPAGSTDALPNHSRNGEGVGTMRQARAKVAGWVALAVAAVGAVVTFFEITVVYPNLSTESVTQQLEYSAAHPHLPYAISELLLGALVALSVGVLPILLQTRTGEADSPVAAGTVFGIVGLTSGALEFITAAWVVPMSVAQYSFSSYFYGSIEAVSSMSAVLGTTFVGYWMVTLGVAAWRRSGMSKAWAVLSLLVGLIELFDALGILGVSTFGQLDNFALVLWFLWTGIELVAFSAHKVDVGRSIAQNQPA